MPQSVLIIDDSPAVHALLAARLKDEPVTLHFASSGPEGLESASRLQPDLILLDVDMPEPNGFEVCRRLKLDETLINTPVVFLTGAGSTSDKVRGLELGGIDYITKPFDAAELRARVRAALRMKFMIDLLASKAQIDALTGLWNRRYFDQRVESEISLCNRARRALSILLLDLDQFKLINEQFGRPVGDEALRRIGHLLIESVRNEDVICRYGSDKFAIIAPNVGQGSLVLAERLRSTIAAPQFVFSAQQIKLTTSIGVAIATEHAEPTIVTSALDALARAKQSGRNRVEVAAAATDVAVKPAA